MFLKQQPDEATTIAQTNSGPPEGVLERATGRRGVWGESRLPGCPFVSRHPYRLFTSPFTVKPSSGWPLKNPASDRVLAEMENDPEIEGVEPVIFVDYLEIDPIL